MIWVPEYFLLLIIMDDDDNNNNKLSKKKYDLKGILGSLVSKKVDLESHIVISL